MAALSHLLENKAQGVGFVAMGDAHRVFWLRTWLGNVLLLVVLTSCMILDGDGDSDKDGDNDDDDVYFV